MRKFYLAYCDRISETVFRKFAVEKSETMSRIFEKNIPFKKMIMNESENTQIITTLAKDAIGKVKKVCNGIL